MKMRINIQRLNKLTNNITESPLTSGIEQEMIKTTVNRFLSGKKLNKVQISLLKDYQLITKKSKESTK
jgi:hypothetical protein